MSLSVGGEGRLDQLSCVVSLVPNDFVAESRRAGRAFGRSVLTDDSKIR